MFALLEKFSADLQSTPPYDTDPAARSGVAGSHECEKARYDVSGVNLNPNSCIGEIDHVAGPHRKASIQANPRFRDGLRTRRFASTVRFSRRLEQIGIFSLER
jgi:hypothetical protein